LDDELPPFADEECREISRQIRLMEKKLEVFDKEANDHSERVVLMKDHLKNVKQEIFYTNGVVAAKKKEVDTEIHLAALAEREKIAVNKDIKSAKDSIQEYQDSIKKLQREKHIANDELDKFKLSLNWKQEELEQWATAAAKRESDNLALEKFRRADEVKIKELTLKLENVNKALVLRRAQVENERTDVQSKELEIQRITGTFKNNHDERRKLISQWQTTVEAMRDRDSEIDIISRKYRNVTELLQNQNNLKSESRGQIEDIKVTQAMTILYILMFLSSILTFLI
jgi:chromosome segregation ATPase